MHAAADVPGPSDAPPTRRSPPGAPSNTLLEAVSHLDPHRGQQILDFLRRENVLPPAPAVAFATEEPSDAPDPAALQQKVEPTFEASRAEPPEQVLEFGAIPPEVEEIFESGEVQRISQRFFDVVQQQVAVPLVPPADPEPPGAEPQRARPSGVQLTVQLPFGAAEWTAPVATQPPDELWAYDDIHHATPEIHRPESVAELQEILASATAAGRAVTLRGGGCSIDAQSLNDDLVIVLAQGDFTRVDPPVMQDGIWTITVGPGATTRRILAATRAEGLIPPVLVSTSHATAGGTLAADCLSRFSTTWGREGGHVIRFLLVTPSGEAIECRRDAPAEGRESRLFRAVIGGLGYLGAVVEITYALRRAAPAGAPIRVETTVDKIPSAEFAWGSFLDALRSAAIEERERWQALSPAEQYGCEEPAADAGNAFGAAWFTKRGMKGMILRSRYRVTEERRPMVLHQPDRVDRVAVELGMTNPDLGEDLNDLFFMFTGDLATFVDDLEGYTFFMDGNVNAKRFARELGSRMTLRQQTFVLPHPTAARFAEEAERHLAAAGAPTTLLDVLYLPAEPIPFLLSSTTDLEGFAMTFAFEDFNASRQRQATAALRAMSRACLDHGGRVHLTKTVEADRDVLDAMYGPRIAEMLELKRSVDPCNVLRNEFFARVLGG